MKNSLAIAFCVLILTLAATAQEQPPRASVSSTFNNSLRYEIVQTAFQSNGFLTFRLDRYTGRVFSLTGCPQRVFIGTALCWKEMIVLELPKPANDNTPRYQIFGQGENNRYVLMINNSTGQTWQLGVDGADKWTPLLDAITLPQSFEIVK